MPVPADHLSRPMHRTLRTALIVSVVFAVIFYGERQRLTESLLVFLAVFALALGVGVLLFRNDIADMVRARRER